MHQLHRGIEFLGGILQQQTRVFRRQITVVGTGDIQQGLGTLQGHIALLDLHIAGGGAGIVFDLAEGVQRTAAAYRAAGWL